MSAKDDGGHAREDSTTNGDNGARIGFFVCHCGTNIASTVDVKAVAERMAALPGVAVSKD